MNQKRVLGFILILTGLFITLTGKTITGNVIGFKPQNYLGWFGILIAVTGVVLVFMAKDEKSMEEMLEEVPTVNGKIKLIERFYRSKRLDEVGVAEELNKISEMQGMNYRPKTQLRVNTATNRHSLTDKNNDDLAIAIYQRILANDPAYDRNCELHISKTISTKHHRKGLK
jgi:hypothetical protein